MKYWSIIMMKRRRPTKRAGVGVVFMSWEVAGKRDWGCGFKQLPKAMVSLGKSSMRTGHGAKELGGG
jgi:hypothetical protein